MPMDVNSKDCGVVGCFVAGNLFRFIIFIKTDLTRRVLINLQDCPSKLMGLGLQNLIIEDWDSKPSKIDR